MPARVLRGEINASRSLARVSLFADLTFRALISAVDDFGRFDGDPLMLKAALFPRREDVTPQHVREWIEELAAEGCVQLYVVDGAAYLCLTGWERHRGHSRRASSSRFPDPPKIEREQQEDPGASGISGRFPDTPGNPLGSRESGVGSREARVEKRESRVPPAAPDGEPPVETQARPTAREVPPDAAAFAEDFRTALEKVHDGFKPPSASAFETWRQEARLMLARDERPIGEARDLAAWLFSDPGADAAFWRPNVMSVPKFREKYDQLKAVMGRTKGVASAAHRGSDLLAWANG